MPVLSRPRFGAARLALGAALVASACSGTSSVTFDGPSVMPPVGKALGVAYADLSRSPTLIDDPLAVAADLALAPLRTATGAADRWSLDLSGNPATADLVALALLNRGIEFERAGPGWDTLSGPGTVPEWEPADPAVTLAAVVGTRGDRLGRIASGDEAYLEWAADLATRVGIASRVEGNSLVADGWSDRVGLSHLDYPCGSVVPLLGPAEACPDPVVVVDEFDDPNLPGWLVGTTGPLQSGQAEMPPSSEGGVGWTNREAQSYRPGMVVAADGVLALTATENPVPSVSSLPFTSGLAFSERTYGYGRFDVEVTIPVGQGLWPAVWLLDVEACRAPGRCDGFGSPDYHEIDLLEVNGSRPTELHNAVHWFDPESEHRSETAVTVPGDLDDGQPHVISVIRRPGVLVWLYDGVETMSIAGPANDAFGPHRSHDMFMIINLAVGGTFAGDFILGPTSPWWGDARVPYSFPDQNWSVAVMTVESVLFTPIG